ncbi:hypothetical protein [Phenylobacterium sp.]|uniref:hypothetical protein n=1 Tax=Phenylobacterium sp. TaxID=1871053 RepID=UPI002737986E|nr:hypothetical protein [Phenylobacterium sp.]MDP3867611.1 hypothetical protein [Phenylobacterium sp.]
MTTEYSPFAKPTVAASDLERRDAEPGSDTPMFSETPIYARPKAGKAKGGVNPLVYAAVPAIALAIGAGVMFMGGPKDEATPPPSATNTVAPAPMLAPSQTAAVTTPPVMAPEAPADTRLARIETPRATARVAPTRVARARPATSAVSAEGSGTNASATIPATPQAYSGLAQTSASAPAAIVVPPVTAAPEAVNPAPSEATPDSAQPEAITVPTP